MYLSDVRYGKNIPLKMLFVAILFTKANIPKHPGRQLGKVLIFHMPCFCYVILENLTK